MPEQKQKRGLARASAETKRRVARAGGTAAHPQGRGLENVSENQRREIARKGGKS